MPDFFVYLTGLCTAKSPFFTKIATIGTCFGTFFAKNKNHSTVLLGGFALMRKIERDSFVREGIYPGSVYIPFLLIFQNYRPSIYLQYRDERIAGKSLKTYAVGSIA